MKVAFSSRGARGGRDSGRLRSCLLLLLLAGLLAGAGLWFLGTGAANALERAASYALGVKTEVGGAGLSLFEGTYSLEDVRIANPPGFDAPHMLRLDRIALHASPRALFADVVELELLEIERLDLELEWKAGHTNYGVLLEHLERFQSKDPSRRLPEEPGTTGPGTREPGAEQDGRRFVIRRVTLHDFNVRYRLIPGLESEPLHVEELELVELGTATEPLDLAAANARIFEDMLRVALERGLERGLFPTNLGQELESALAGLRAAGGGALEAAGAGLESALEKALPGGLGKILAPQAAPSSGPGSKAGPKPGSKPAAEDGPGGQ